MKIKLANKRSKQSVDPSLEEPIGAIAKHNYAKSNPAISDHSNYIPKTKTSQETIPPKPTQAKSDITNAEVIESYESRHTNPIKLRLTNKCRNCDTIIDSTENYCHMCKMMAKREYGQEKTLNQTIIIRERRRGGCFSNLISAILFIILLPYILYLLGWMSLGAIIAWF